MKTIEYQSMRTFIPSGWSRYGFRVFFNHVGDTLLDDFASRDSRPIREYNKIIRDIVVPVINETHGPLNSITNLRLKQQPNQFPQTNGMLNLNWLPRTAHCVMIPAGRIVNYSVNIEVIVEVMDV